MWICQNCRTEESGNFSVLTDRPMYSGGSTGGYTGNMEDQIMQRMVGHVRKGVICFIIAMVLYLISSLLNTFGTLSLDNDLRTFGIVLGLIAVVLLIYVAWVSIEVIIDWIRTRHQTLKETRRIREMLEKQ